MKKLFVGLVLAVSLAGCSAATAGSQPGGSDGGGSPSPGSSASPGIAHPTGASDIVLRVDTDGGFVAPGWLLTHLPQFTLYGDGRIVTPGAQILIYPAPALPSLVVERVSEEGIARILRAAEDAGLFGADRSLPLDGIADAPTTTFTLTAGGATHVTSAYALGMDQPAPDPGAADAIARALLAEFVGKLGDLEALVGTALVEPPAAYEFSALRLYIDVYQPPAEGDIAPTYVTWPGASLAELGSAVPGHQGTRCALVEGTDLAAVLPALRTSNALTGWKSGGGTWALRLRPLLPDESGCGASA